MCEKIIGKLGFPEECQYAFGDGLNDIEMLSTIKHSVAMGNAEEKVKGAAKYVTKSVEDNGIYDGLQMVGLLSEIGCCFLKGQKGIALLFLVCTSSYSTAEFFI